MKTSNAFRTLTAGIKLKKPRPSQTTKEHQEANETIFNEPPDSADDIRALLSIDVDGSDVPDPVLSFEEMGTRFNIPKTIMTNLTKGGFHRPTPIQMQAIPLLMDEREVICSAPTGSGKTLAFLLPLVTQLTLDTNTSKEERSNGFRAIVLAPTRELAKQLHREFLWISEGSGLRIHIINDVDKAIQKFDSKLGSKKDILITTPKRLMVLLGMDPPILALNNLRWLIIDECDKLFEAEFREQLAVIYKACSQSKHVRRAMFSATFDDSLEEWFKMNLNDVVSLVVGGKNVPTDSVKQSLEYVGNEDGKRCALKNLILDGLDAPVLIFVDKKETAKRVFKDLITHNINSDCIHSDRLQSERDKIVKQFREGKIMFLICTELMGRGIDFKAVNTIINYDCPTSLINYIHRIGRTGRGGKTGTAITFYTDRDISRLREIAKVLQKAGCPVPDSLLSTENPSPPKSRRHKQKKRKNKKKQQLEEDVPVKKAKHS